MSKRLVGLGRNGIAILWGPSTNEWAEAITEAMSHKKPTGKMQTEAMTLAMSHNKPNGKMQTEANTTAKPKAKEILPVVGIRRLRTTEAKCDRTRAAGNAVLT